VLFLILLIFKFNEPAAVKIYLSDCLHECYRNYLQGKYNHLLLPQDYPDSGTPLMPHTFEQFMLTVYVKSLTVLQTDAILQQIELSLKKLTVQGENLKRQRALLETGIGSTLDEISKDIATKESQCDVLKNEIMKTQFHFTSIANIYDGKREELRKMEIWLETNKGVGGILEVRLTMATLEMKKDIRELEDELREIELSKNEKNTQLQRLEGMVNDLKQTYKDLIAPLKEFDTMIEENRRNRAYYEDKFMRHIRKSFKEETGEQGAGQQTSEQGYQNDKTRQN
jgi:hypothetical protein